MLIVWWYVLDRQAFGKIIWRLIIIADPISRAMRGAPGMFVILSGSRLRIGYSLANCNMLEVKTRSCDEPSGATADTKYDRVMRGAPNSSRAVGL